MINFANNWKSPIELSQGVTTALVDLPDGEYRITISDALGAEAARWEIIGATVVAGAAALERGLEGTSDQDWPEGSIAYIGITAGALQAMQQATADARGVADEALTMADEALAAGGGISDYGPPVTTPPRAGAVYCDLATFDIYIAGKADFPGDWAGPFSVAGRAAYVEMRWPQSVTLPKSIGRVVAQRDFPEDGPGDFTLTLPELDSACMISFTVSAQAHAGSRLLISRPPGTTMTFSQSGPSLGATFSQGSARIPMQRMELLVTYSVNDYGDGVLHVLTQHLEP